MKCFVPILLILAALGLQEAQAQNYDLSRRYGEPKKVGVVYLIELFLPQPNQEEVNNFIPNNGGENFGANNKLLLSLAPPNAYEKSTKDVEDNSRTKRSPGGCTKCGGGGGGGGGYPGGGSFGGGGKGGGGGGGGSWSQASSSASSGSFGGGNGGGKYGK